MPARGLFVVIVMALGCRRGPQPPAGDIAATLTVPEIADHPLDPASLRGNPSLVLFVTPTCPHCLATIPRAVAAAKSRGANVVAVFVAGQAQDARGVVEHTRFPGAALVDDGALTKRYAIRYVPYTLVLGADGHATAALEGEQEEAALEAALDDAR